MPTKGTQGWGAARSTPQHPHLLELVSMLLGGWGGGGRENTVAKSGTRPPPRGGALCIDNVPWTSESEGLGEHGGGGGGCDKQGFLEKEIK